MATKLETLEDLFFTELKSYNSTNFRTLLRADLLSGSDNSTAHKAFSSVITRYFIFREKHIGELTDSEFNMLYFQLKLDLISQYFSEYPNSDLSTLTSFQKELRAFNDRNKHHGLQKSSTKV